MTPCPITADAELNSIVAYLTKEASEYEGTEYAEWAEFFARVFRDREHRKDTTV